MVPHEMRIANAKQFIYALHYTWSPSNHHAARVEKNGGDKRILYYRGTYKTLTKQTMM
jgi:hypothetical protein